MNAIPLGRTVTEHLMSLDRIPRDLRAEVLLADRYYAVAAKFCKNKEKAEEWRDTAWRIYGNLEKKV